MKTVLPARAFAAAWSNVALASRPDEVPGLNQTVCVEVYDTTAIRLVACDRISLLHSAVIDDDSGEIDAPDVDDEPEHTFIASDADGRMANLAAYLLKVTKDDPARTVTLTTEQDPAEGAQMSLDGMDRLVLVVDADIEKVLLPVIDTSFPNWRAVTFKSRRSDLAAFNGERLGIFGKLKELHGPVTFAFNGRNGMAKVEAETVPPLEGYLAPVRVADEIPTLLDAEGFYTAPVDEPGDDDA